MRNDTSAHLVYTKIQKANPSKIKKMKEKKKQKKGETPSLPTN